MHQTRLRRLLAHGSMAALAVTTIALSAFGSSAASVNKSLKLGTDFPVSGSDTGAAKPAENGVRLAIMQNSSTLGNGYTLSILAENDEKADGSGASGDIGKANIQKLIDDSSVMAGVGPFNSGVAQVEMPLINSAGLAFISPSNTNPGLTKRQYADANGIANFDQLHPAGKPEAYFRLPATDDVQGMALATIAAAPKSLGGPEAHKVFVVDDTTTYGVGLSNYFTTDFMKAGGTILGRESITSASETTAIPGLVTKILGLQPDLVFYGGVTSQGGADLKKAIAAANPAAHTDMLPFLGGDGIANDSQWATKATPAGAINSIGTIPSFDAKLATTSAAQDFANQYKAAFPGADFTSYSTIAYDAAMIEINVIKQLIKDGKAVTRANVRAGVAGISYNGLSGQIGFDSNGDNTGPKVFDIWAIIDNSGKWTKIQQVTA